MGLRASCLTRLIFLPVCLLAEPVCFRAHRWPGLSVHYVIIDKKGVIVRTAFPAISKCLPTGLKAGMEVKLKLTEPQDCCSDFSSMLLVLVCGSE